MQNYQEKPIPLVIRQPDGKYAVNSEAIELFLSVKGKLAIISVAGVYRTGKSYLLNKMLLNRKSGFAVGPTINPETKGIWVWGKPLIFKNKEDEMINVLVLDSEGLGSTEEDINHDLRLFSITLLMSSSFLYNTVGAIDENALDSLGLVLRLCEHLKNENFNDFPDFNWILRDFSLALRDKNGESLTSKEYLEACLSNQFGDTEVRNKIRNSIKQAFVNRDCYVFVRPLLDEKSLQNLDDMELQELRPQFVEQVIEFRKSIYNNLKVKSIKGRQIHGEMLCDLLKIYVDCINSDKLPVIESGWQQLCLKEVHELIEEIEQTIAKRVKDLKQNRLPRTKKQLFAEQEALMKQFQQIFQRKLKDNHKAGQYFGNIEQIINKELKGIEEEMKITNTQQTQSFVKKQFENIQKRLKNAEFKNMGQLVKEFEIFYEYYRKKCPYKDDIQTGLEFMLKKFSDSSLIMYKSMQKKKDEQIEQLNNEIFQINADFTMKEQKMKQERLKMQDKNVKIQANLDQLKKQNIEMIKKIEEYEFKIEEFENQSRSSNEEKLQTENLEFKKLIMELEQREKDLICTQNSEINSLRQQIILKNNEIENEKKINEQLNFKLQQLEIAYNFEKEEGSARLDEMTRELQIIMNQKLSIEKSLKNKLDDREKQLSQLENAFEAKCEELNDVTNNKTFLESSMISEQALFDEKRSLEEKVRENQILQKEIQSVSNKYETKIKELIAELNEKQTSFKIGKLELEQEKALLVQKLEFIERESNEKNQKNKVLQAEITNYVSLLDEKDQQIQDLINELEQYKTFGEAESEQIETKIKEMSEQLEKKSLTIARYEEQVEELEKENRKRAEEQEFRIKELEAINDNYEQGRKKLEEKLSQVLKQKEDEQNSLSVQLETMRNQHNRDRQDQKRNAELSLVQLKNFYEMEKQRLEKRILEERKKYEYSENSKILELSNQHAKQIKALSEQNKQLSEKLQQTEQQLMKCQNQYEVKVLGLEEELESERRSYQNRYDILKRKYDDNCEELAQIESQYEEDRIGFVKKIEGLNFQISKKEKQIMQGNVKRQSLEATISKKQNQLESLKKTMHQQIESSLKKVSEVQAKAQKINEQYIEFKIQAEKQNALSKQRNQFLNARLSELSKEKQIGSLKNIEKLDRQKINQLKEQLEKQKSENISLQAKIQNLRKNQKQKSNVHKKELNQVQKESLFLQQKNQLNESKIKELQAKITQKNQTFMKDIEEIRIKHQQERLKLQGDIDILKEKLNSVEDEKNQISWKYQKQIALVSDRIKYAEYQRDQNKKQLQETEKRLQSALGQLKRNNERGLDQSGIGKRQSLDKRYSSQMQLVRMSSKAKQQELEQTNKRLKEQLKQYKQKLLDCQQKISKTEKLLAQQKILSEQVDKLKRQKEHLIMVHRNEFAKENDEFKKKYAELEKKNREVERKNGEFLFLLEKQKAKYGMEKQSLVERVKELEDTLAWERKNAQPKNKAEGSKSKRFSATTSGFMEWK